MLRTGSRVTEPLQEAELAFLQKKKDRQQQMFYRALRTLTIICILIPFLVGLIMHSLRQEAGARQPAEEFHDSYYLIGMGVLLALVALAGYYSYVRTLKKLVLDLKEQTKTIEKTEITRKQFMPSTRTFHFFLHSAVRLSIEVSAGDFERYEVGDEINIEYSSHAEEYFGYF